MMESKDALEVVTTGINLTGMPPAIGFPMPHTHREGMIGVGVDRTIG